MGTNVTYTPLLANLCDLHLLASFLRFLRPMAPKSKEAILMKKFEQEKKREFVLDLWRQGKSYGYIATEVAKVFKGPCSRSTVQSIVRYFKDRPTVAQRSSGGRPSKMTAQYACFDSLQPSFTKFLGTKDRWVDVDGCRLYSVFRFSVRCCTVCTAKVSYRCPSWRISV